MAFNVGQMIGLARQLGGDHEQLAKQLQGVEQVDPQQHAGLLSQFGIDPQQLANGGYEQRLQQQEGGAPGQGGPPGQGGDTGQGPVG